MKVCMLAYAYYFTDARIKAYANSLLNIGISVDVLSLKEPNKNISIERSDGLQIYYLSSKYIGKNKIHYILSYIKFFVLALLKVSILQTKSHYRIIHIHNMPNFIVFSAIVPKILGAKIILDMHDIMSQNFIERFKSKGLFLKLLKYEEKLSCKFADIIICADMFQKKFLIYNRNVNPDKIHIMMNLPDIKIFYPRGEKTLAKEKYFNIVYHGTITYRLGIDIILKAILKVKEFIPCRFFLYGTGDYLGECLKIIGENHLDDIVFASKKFFRVEDLPILLKDKALGIIGNRKSEAAKYMLPVKMMEYMAMNIPVIAPRVENISYYFDESLVCFYEPENISDLADKIIYLYEHSDERKKLSANAYGFIQKHNWQMEEKKYYSLIDELCK